MALEDFGLTVDDIVTKRLPEAGPRHSTSKPTDTAADELLDGVLSEVNGLLTSIGITPSDIDATDEIDYPLIRRMVEIGFMAEFLDARAGGTTEASKEKATEYRQLKRDLKKTPEMLSDNFSTSGTASQPTSHITQYGVADQGTVTTDGTPPMRPKEHF